MSWSVIDHTADAGLEVSAVSWGDLFHHVAEGFYFLCLDGATLPCCTNHEGRRHVVSLEALDLEELIIEWVNELLFLLESEGVLFFVKHLCVAVEPAFLRAEGVLYPSLSRRVAVKAATYGGMELRRLPHPFLRLYLDM